MENVNRFQDSVGMKIVGHFTDRLENKYIWLRSYRDEAARLQSLMASSLERSGGNVTIPVRTINRTIG
jgi:hypothetical protein